MDWNKEAVHLDEIDESGHHWTIHRWIPGFEGRYTINRRGEVVSHLRGHYDPHSKKTYEIIRIRVLKGHPQYSKDDAIRNNNYYALRTSEGKLKTLTRNKLLKMTFGEDNESR